MTTASASMTDEHDTTDERTDAQTDENPENDAQRVSFTIEGEGVAATVARAYDAAGVEYDTATITRFVVDRVDENPDLGDVLERSATRDPGPVPDERWEPDENPESEAKTDAKEVEAGNENASEDAGTEQRPAGSETGNGPDGSASGSDDSSPPDSPDEDGEDDSGNWIEEATTGSSPDSTTDTISGAETAASSTTSDPMPEERREQLSEYPDGIVTLDHSEAAKFVYGAIANANREWVATPEIPIDDEDLPGDSPVNTVARHMWRGGIFDRREIEGRTVKRCTYEYRIAPDKRGAGE